MKQVHTCLHILFLQIYQIFSTKPVNLSKQKKKKKTPKQQNKIKQDPQNQNHNHQPIK